MTDDITVCIPSIPPRNKLLRRALQTILSQTQPAAGISVAVDLHHEGAPATRDRALRAARTGWVAFLDDDDQFLPQHLEKLLAFALETDSDYVYSWFEPVGFGDCLGHFGKVFDPANPTQTTITTLVRTELAQEVGFRQPPPGALIDGQTYGEDFQFTIECIRAGARITHLPERTWLWNYHGGNTSGQADRW